MVEMDLTQLLYFIVLGIVGSVAYVLTKSKTYDDFFKFDSVRRYLVGAVVGGIYDLLYSDYGFPNSLMCIVAGYSGTHFLEELLSKLQSK